SHRRPPNPSPTPPATTTTSQAISGPPHQSINGLAALATGVIGICLGRQAVDGFPRDGPAPRISLRYRREYRPSQARRDGDAIRRTAPADQTGYYKANPRPVPQWPPPPPPPPYSPRSSPP